MSVATFQQLHRLLQKIDRPGSFCVSGSAPLVLPGLEVAGLGPVGLPLTAAQAKKLKKLCAPAPYGKGEATLVDARVRRAWRLTTDRFTLTNPEWDDFLRQTVAAVQEGLGLEKQGLESHLYDLLLYEPGGFFLPHRDGEKRDRMVATLVVVLPSAFVGGELVVRHDGQEQVIDFGGGADPAFRLHYAAFYADCEHEIRPLVSGYRLCLIYNLTLKKGKKVLGAPRTSEYVEPVARLLAEWAGQGAPRKLAVTLGHRYTQDGLTWDALKGADRPRARVLLEAAKQAGCPAYLALLTLHETGAAEGEDDYYYSRRRRWGEYDDEPGGHEMGEIYETSLTADHWCDSAGHRLPFGEIDVDEGELLDPGALKTIEPEEQFEGYTGNEGMTLDRWYRHGAIFLWPEARHFEILCGAGTHNAIASLKLLVERWQQAKGKNAAALRGECVAFASAILATWKSEPYGHDYYARRGEPSAFMPLLAALDEPGLMRTYLAAVVANDPAEDPGSSLAPALRRHGLAAFGQELEAVFRQTTAATLGRNVRLLEQLFSAKPRKKDGGPELCAALARTTVEALERIDQKKADPLDYWPRRVDRSPVLAGLARALLAGDQGELLGRVVDHTLALPETYPLTAAHVAALTALGPWLPKHLRQPCPALSRWLAACCEQLEALTAELPRPPADMRRPAAITHQCADCAELKRFLEDPQESVHRFRVREDRRRHLQDEIRHHGCDLDCRTERTSSPHILVCTKNTASYEARLAKYHQDQKDLAALRAIQARLPAW